MLEREKQVGFEQLPPRVRAAFERMRDVLEPGLTLGNLRETTDGWTAGIFTPEGHHGGDFLVLAEEGEKPLG